MKQPEIKTDAHFSVPEHEILLSFQNDDDAVKFFEWWYDDEGGWTTFAEWLQNDTSGD
jgi:hypothetical protein